MTEHTQTAPRVLLKEQWVRQRKTNTICSHLYMESKKKLLIKKNRYATSNKDLLYSTGNYSQYPVINEKKPTMKNNLKNNVYLYNRIILLCT